LGCKYEWPPHNLPLSVRQTALAGYYWMLNKFGIPFTICGQEKTAGIGAVEHPLRQ